MNTYESLSQYYQNTNEDARLRTRRGLPEFLTTVQYVERYLKTHDRILEIGAGSGRYTHHFAQNGYEVDAVELIPCNIEKFHANTQAGERVTVTQANALDLSHIASGIYDITLLLGPMYHLYTVAKQKQALAEAIRVTKPGGIVFVAYCNSDMTMYQYCFVKENYKRQAEKNKIDPDTFKLYSLPEDVFQLYRKEDIDALIAPFPVTRLHYVGTDMLTRFISKTVEEMDDEMFDIYMRYHLSICERHDMIGATNHILDIIRKEGNTCEP